MSSPATNFAQLLTPLQVLRRFDVHDFSIDEFFRARLRQLSGQAMVEYQGDVMTWQNCADQADLAVAWLLQRGIQAGDRIGLMAYNHPATVVLLLACARIGAILVPCNPEFEAREAKYIFEHAGVRGVICSPEPLSKVQEATQHMPTAPWQVVIEEDQAGSGWPASLIPAPVQARQTAPA
jgi:acyl-CoA synthetase (AMP-forming)/AMP-acid ligase II